MNLVTDTIAAIATAPGAAGIAIVRVSGSGALGIADRMFRSGGAPPSQRLSHTVVHGWVVGAAGETLDEVLLVIMRAPRSYTGEDTVEFQCHGGTISATRILRRAVELGCRIAEPGEFTKRAFLNGRVDLSQADGVLALIQAGSERAADAALRLMKGELGHEINRMYDLIVTSTASLDASLDFPEEDMPEDTLEAALQAAQDALGICRKLLSTWSCGKILRDGFRVAIIGRTNAGKSSLFNMLLGHGRAIVSEHPGTTRDTIEQWIQINGFQVCLVDTAGFADTSCPIEAEGIRRSRAEIQGSDMVLYCLPSNEINNPIYLDILREMPKCSTVVAITKCDLNRPSERDKARIPFANVESTIVDPRGTSERVRVHILEMITKTEAECSTSPIIISERHRAALDSAREALEQAISLMESQRPDAPILSSECMKDAAESLARITGRVYDKDLLDQIFGTFCIGK